MRIVYIVTRGDAVGGASIHVRDLSSAMQERGHHVLVITGGCGPVTDELARVGVPFRTVQSLARAINPVRDLAAVMDVAKAIRAWRPDLVSTHTAKAGIIGRLAARFLNIPAIFTPHGWTIGDRLGRTAGRVFTAAERIAAPWAAAIVDVCQAEKKLALQRGIGRPRQHHVIYNGVHEVEPDLVASTGNNITPVRIVCVARFEPPKDHSTLIASLSGLSGFHLDLIGDGPLLAETQRQVQQLGLGEQVTFYGYLQDPAAVLAQAHLFVLSSLSEAFPRSILEAMRAGLPVIASEVGGVGEAVNSGNGILFPARDAVRLRSAILELLESPSRRQRLGEFGHLKYRQFFQFQRTLLETELLYQKVT